MVNPSNWHPSMGPNDTPLTMCAGCGKFVQHPLLHAVEIHGKPDAGGQLLGGSETTMRWL